MTTRILAWAMVLGVIYGAYKVVQNWNNPWSSPSVASVTSVMPKMTHCKEDCLK